jgi:GMP synthase-like glutamine amidotransferase
MRGRLDPATALVCVAVAGLLVAYARRRRRGALATVATRRRAPRIAYLNTEDAPKWADQRSIFAEALRMPLECLEPFDCFAGEFPSRDALHAFDALLITGSHFSALDPTLPWLPHLFDTIRAAAALPAMRVVGCCFGAQACAVALGGEVASNPAGNFVLGWTQLELQLELSRHKWARGAFGAGRAPPRRIGLLESHGEQVVRLPEGAELLASSEGTPHELFLCGASHNVLCCQAHPEFDECHLRERIGPALRAKGRLSEDELEGIEAEMIARHADSDAVRQLYRNFLLHAQCDDE